MLKLAPKNLRPGMVLARSVYNSKGMLVTPVGTKWSRVILIDY